MGRIQWIQHRVGTKWGILRQPLDLMNRPNTVAQKANREAMYMILYNWFSRSYGDRKLKYNCTNTNWVDVDSITSTISLVYKKVVDLYWLDADDASNLDEFVATKR